MAVNKLSRTSLPLRPRALPVAGSVDLWLVDLADLPLDPVPSGTNRSGALRARRIRQQFMLRLLLGSYLGCPGREVELTRRERGKPGLGGPHADSPLQFNLSHSGGWLAMVVARDCPVGVDIEYERSLPRAAALARRYFPNAEARLLVSLDEPFRSRSFLQHWTAREALVKAHGCGLAGMLKRIELTGSPPALARLPQEWVESAPWSLVMPRLPGGVVGHVAAASGKMRVQTYLLDPSTGRPG